MIFLTTSWESWERLELANAPVEKKQPVAVALCEDCGGGRSRGRSEKGHMMV